jgi:CubicO group peptidase (beta-lactamase class C family)
LRDRFTQYPASAKDWEGKTDIDYRRDYTGDELVKVAMQLAPDFAPETRWSYSNTGYVLLGILVHKVSGQFYGDFLAERVLRPLDMQSTRIISEPDIVRNRASGYTLESGKLRNQEWVSPSLNTTADGTTYPHGFAWLLDVQRGEPVLEHGGSWQGCRAAIARYPGRKLTVIVLANLTEAEAERRFRFFLNDAGAVTESSSEPVG